MWFATLADLAVKSTAVLGAAWIAALLLRRRSAAARHLVWTAAAVAVLSLPFLSLSLPGLPVRGAGAILPSGGVVFQATATARAEDPAAQKSRQTPVGSTAPTAPSRPDWRLWLALVWTAGAALLGVQMLVACATIARLRRAAEPWPEHELGTRYQVDVLQTPAGSMPMTYGILRPAVFLPADAVEWSDGLRHAVLLHEMAHVRRGDVATQLVARLALAMHWWNPLAWTAWRQFLKERERAADDMVLDAGTRASDYAGHLLAMARTRQTGPALAWAAVCMARRSQLEGRLVAILDARTRRAAAGRRSAGIAALAAVALVAPLAAVRAERPAPGAVVPVVDAAVQAVVPEAQPTPGIRESESPARSAAYGAGLLKIADLERQRRRADEAEAFYTKAIAVLGERAETASAFLYLGLRRKDPEEAIGYLRTAERLDASQTGAARMWMAVMRERQRRGEEAEALYKSALAEEKPESAQARSTQRLYARFLRQNGRASEAEAIEKQAASAVRGKFPEASPGVFRVGNGVKPPALLRKLEPQYSEEARAAKYQGTVVIYAEIGTDGLAHNMRVLRGLGLGLDEKAMEAIDHWRFRPGSKEGTPVPVAATIEVNFRLL